MLKDAGASLLLTSFITSSFNHSHPHSQPSKSSLVIRAAWYRSERYLSKLLYLCTFTDDGGIVTKVLPYAAAAGPMFWVDRCCYLAATIAAAVIFRQCAKPLLYVFDLTGIRCKIDTNFHF